MLIRLRNLSGDPRFSDQDAARTLKGLGSGLLGQDFPGQLQAAQRFFARSHDSLRKGLEVGGFDVQGIEPLLPKVSGGGGSRSAAPTDEPADFTLNPRTRQLERRRR